MILRAMVTKIRTQKLHRGSSRICIFTNRLELIHAVFLGLTKADEVELEYLPLCRFRANDETRTIAVTDICDVVYLGVYRNRLSHSTRPVLP